MASLKDLEACADILADWAKFLRGGIPFEGSDINLNPDEKYIVLTHRAAQVMEYRMRADAAVIKDWLFSQSEMETRSEEAPDGTSL